jgi:SulP family sulfate permease
MAYAMIAGLPPKYGLYTAIVMTGVGALLDTSRQLINGPTNAISIALLSAVGGIAAEGDKVQVAVTLALMIGVIQVGVSLLRLGDLTRYISHSVIVGFTAGASVLLLLDQTKNLLGQKTVGDVHDHFLLRFWNSLTQGGPVHVPTLAVGLGTVALVLLLRAIKARLRWPLFPELLVVVVTMAGITAWLGLDQQGVKVVGEIPAGLPSFHLPTLDATQIQDLASGALAIALLGLLEAISMAKSIAAITRQKLDMNQQCLSEGVANVAGSLFQCMPGSGSLTRSAINQQAGAQTQWAAILSAVAVAGITLLVAPYARFIPRSALAGILMLTAIRMVNLKDLRYHLRASRFDAAIVVATAVAAVAISIEFCVLIGVFMSFLLTVPRAGRMLLTEFVVTAEGGIHERVSDDTVCGRILLFGLEGEMFFGAAGSLEQHFSDMEDRIGPKTAVVVLRMKRARNPDAVGMALLEAFIERVTARGVRPILCGVRQDLVEALDRTGLREKLGEDQVFVEQPVRQTSTQLAIRHAYTLVAEPCEACPRRDPAVKERGLYYVR